jgi:hypothetical protein
MELTRTLRKPILPGLVQVNSRDIPDWAKLLIVGDVDVRFEVMRCEPQLSNQPLVSEDGLFFAKDRIGKLWMEGRESCWLVLAALHK